MTNQCDDVAKLAAGLTDQQRRYLTTETGAGRGLVQRGLLRHRWGNDPSFGYIFTAKGLAVRNHLQQKGSSHD